MSTVDRYPVGDTVRLTFHVRDDDGELADASLGATIVVERPDGAGYNLTVSHPSTGVYEATYSPTLAGRHQVVFTASGTNGGVAQDLFDAYAVDLGYVTVADLRAYLGDTSASDGVLTDVLAAEQAAQQARCRIEPYGPDLREALLRRCARNLAARAVPIAQYTSFEGGGTSSRVPTTDPEIARLEAPHRRRKVG